MFNLKANEPLRAIGHKLKRRLPPTKLGRISARFAGSEYLFSAVVRPVCGLAAGYVTLLSTTSVKNICSRIMLGIMLASTDRGFSDEV